MIPELQENPGELLTNGGGFVCHCPDEYVGDGIGLMGCVLVRFSNYFQFAGEITQLQGNSSACESNNCLNQATCKVRENGL